MKYLSVILLLFALFGCLKEDPLKKEYTGYKPLDIGDGWKTGTALNNQIDSIALNQVYQSVYEDDDLWQVKSLSVFRNGEIIAESYLKDELDRTRPQAIWSCTKQVVSLLIGTLWDRQKLYMSDRAEQILPIPFIGHREKEAITIDHLLSMRSGISFDNDEHSDVFRKKEVKSSLDFVLGLDMNFYPGTEFNYNDGDPQILSAIIQELTGRKTFVYADQVLFSKIGLTNYSWEEYTDGITLGGFGILMTPRELAKVGQLVLNKGRWDSTQVISQAWISDMLSVKSPVSFLDNIDFGYDWWLHRTKGYRFMWGHGGQFVFLIPEKNAMVVFSSLEQVEGGFELTSETAIEIVDKIAATMH